MNTKKIGVWGLGVVGKSVITFLRNQHITPAVINKNYSHEELVFLEENNIPAYMQEKDLDFFLDTHDTIIASPGIDLRPYARHVHKWATEIDLFYSHTTTPIIAITGTLGKTSLTTLLAHLLQSAQVPVAVGGNIGTGMLDLLQAPESAYILLELSSFQLEHSKQFAPHLAIITNIYPNHLDRHSTLHEYLQAKFHVLKYQTNRNQALLPFELYEHVTKQFPDRSFSFFSLQQPENMSSSHTYYYTHNNQVIQQTAHQKKSLISMSAFPESSFVINWIMLTAILDLLNLNPAEIIKNNGKCPLPEHRVDVPIIKHGIAFYNDSKSTIIESTYAAVTKIAPHKPILLLGGLSKGVDRTQSLHLFKDKVQFLVCFGAEATTLAHAATTIDIPTSCHATLEEAFNAALSHAHQGDHILLSPGGSSFDLFADYKARGKRFEELIDRYDGLQQKL